MAAHFAFNAPIYISVGPKLVKGSMHLLTSA
jgi:hypothetical protein